jgi:hypothetical protein
MPLRQSTICARSAPGVAGSNRPSTTASRTAATEQAPAAECVPVAAKDQSLAYIGAVAMNLTPAAHRVRWAGCAQCREGMGWRHRRERGPGPVGGMARRTTTPCPLPCAEPRCPGRRVGSSVPVRRRRVLPLGSRWRTGCCERFDDWRTSSFKAERSVASATSHRPVSATARHSTTKVDWLKPEEFLFPSRIHDSPRLGTRRLAHRFEWARCHRGSAAVFFA